MRSILGRHKHNKKLPSAAAIEQAAERISQRGDIIEKKIKKLDGELLSYGEQIKKTRPGPAQDAVKAHALCILKQKRRYEAQKSMLDNQRTKLERVSSAAEGLKKGQKTACRLAKDSRFDQERALRSLLHMQNRLWMSLDFGVESFMKFGEL